MRSGPGGYGWGQRGDRPSARPAARGRYPGRRGVDADLDGGVVDVLGPKEGGVFRGRRGSAGQALAHESDEPPAAHAGVSQRELLLLVLLLLLLWFV